MTVIRVLKAELVLLWYWTVCVRLLFLSERTVFPGPVGSIRMAGLLWNWNRAAAEIVYMVASVETAYPSRSFYLT